MANFWVLVADSARARIFNAETASAALDEIKDISHTEARLHERDLTSDLPGKNSNHSGKGHHAMDSETSAKKYEAAEFAKIISKDLEKARTQNAFKYLVVVAAPAFLGLLRDAFSGEMTKMITLQVDKNLTQQKPEDIRDHLPAYLPGDLA